MGDSFVVAATDLVASVITRAASMATRVTADSSDGETDDELQINVTEFLGSGTDITDQVQGK